MTVEGRRHEGGVTLREFRAFQRTVQRRLKALTERVERLEAAGPVGGIAVAASLRIGGTMPGAINVDTQNENATVEFKDDKGNKTDAPAGVTVAFGSDNPAVATVQNDAGNPLQGNISPVAPGEATISVTISGAVEPNGQPFAVDPVKVTVSPGPAAGADLVLSV